MVKEEKLKALDAAIGQIEKQYGKGSVMKLGDKGNRMQVETRSEERRVGKECRL